MNLFHKNINQELAELINFLFEEGYLTNEWYWDNEKIKRLSKIDSGLLESLIELLQNHRLNRDKFNRLAPVIINFKRALVKCFRNSSVGRKKDVALVNAFLRKLEQQILIDLPVHVWVVGWTNQRFDTEKAISLLRVAYDRIEKRYRHRRKMLVFDGIKIGIQGLAYGEAIKRQWLVTTNVNPYEVDVLVRIGSTNLAFREAEEAKDRNIEVIEFNLKADIVTISHIDGINRVGYVNLKKRDDLKKAVELPLLKACRILYDKNIRTVWSSANIKNVGHYAHISIDFDSLSDDNKSIAESIGKVTIHADGKTVEILIPIEHEGVPIADLERKSMEIAKKFKKQKMKWGVPGLESSIKHFQEQGMKPAEITRILEIYYDRSGKQFYLSEEHYRKSKE